MNELDLQAIRERADAATKGPWRADLDRLAVRSDDDGWPIVLDVRLGDDDAPQACSDVEFIAAARSDVPALLDEVERLRANWGPIEQMFADAASSVDESVRTEQRLRSELRDARNDLLDVRGLLCPNGGDSVLPEHMVDIGERVAPAVEWLIDEVERLREHILDIDAHATPYGDIPGEPGYVGTYLLTAGALHRALGTIGHSAARCQAEAERDAARAEVERLQAEELRLLGIIRELDLAARSAKPHQRAHPAGTRPAMT